MTESNLIPNQPCQFNKGCKTLFKWIILIFIVIILASVTFIYQLKISSKQSSTEDKSAINTITPISTPIDTSNIISVYIDRDTSTLIAINSDNKKIILDQNVSDWSDYIHTHSIDFKKSNGIIFYGKRDINSRNEDLYFYNINTNQKTKLDTITQTIIFYSWSSNGSYLVVSYGTPFNSDNEINIYNSNGKLIKNIMFSNSSEGKSIGVWLNDNQFIYNQTQNTGRLTSCGIALLSINGSDVNTKVIKQADNSNEYVFLSLRDSDTFSFKKRTFKFKELLNTWNITDEHITYWKMNLNGENLIRINLLEAIT